jgi:hypothetical protein
MSRRGRFIIVAALALPIVLSSVASNYAQSSSATVYHQIDGRLHTTSGQAASNVRVRLLRSSTLRPVGETFSRSRGEFEFNYVTEGEYLIETFETPLLEATSTSFQVRPLPKERSAVLHVEVDIPIKPPAVKPSPGVISADVDLLVPKEALKHYRAALKALGDNDSARAVEKFQEAIKAHPEFYAARLDLGRELRRQKRLKEAEEVLVPLRLIAPKRAEPLVEHALVLLQLQRRAEAATELRAALQLEEANWSAHFYLGWALLDEQPNVAESHFRQAIEIDGQKAVRAHLALARLADAKGLRQLAIKHLESYLVVVPGGPEADTARALVERLRKLNQPVNGNSPQP